MQRALLDNLALVRAVVYVRDRHSLRLYGAGGLEDILPGAAKLELGHPRLENAFRAGFGGCFGTRLSALTGQPLG